MSWGVDFAWKGVVLVDGFISAAWRVRRERRSATMTVELVAPLDAPTRLAVEEEAERLFAFVAADAETREVRFVVVEKLDVRHTPAALGARHAPPGEPRAGRRYRACGSSRPAARAAAAFSAHASSTRSLCGRIGQWPSRLPISSQ